MKKRIVIIGVALLFLLAVPFAAMGCSKGDPSQPGKEVFFVVKNPDHVQVLGGKSVHAWIGLLNAAAQSPAVMVTKDTSGGKVDKK